MSKWNDHKNVVVLEYIVRKLIIENCKGADQPNEKIAEWTQWFKDQESLVTKFAFSKGVSTEVQLEAIGLASQFKIFHEDFEKNLNEKEQL